MIDYRRIRAELENSLLKYGHKFKFKRPNDNKNYNIYLIDGLVKVQRNNEQDKILTWDEFLHCWLEMRKGY